ncbi:MAG: 6-bladed beta-propeller [Cyclobacteriaceae bacterium]|nr:6-bladed beta-propeller [Cyclobacteriaceae bacterium]
MNKLLTLYFLLVLTAIIAFDSGKLQAQDTLASNNQAAEMSYVRWVSEFPSTQKKQSKKGLFKRIGTFIFGKKPALLVKPVAVLAHNPEMFWVVDQKTTSLVLINQQKASTVKLTSKSEKRSNSLVDICELPGKGLLITDSYLNKIFLVPNDSKEAIIFNNSLSLQQPTGIAYAKEKDEIWVLETKAHRIAVLNAKGKLLKTIGSRGNAPGEFNFPTHIWIDRHGQVYIVDSMNFRVQIFNSEGKWISMFGQAGDGSGYFARPKGIATDSHGNIYVADALFHTVQIFNKKGQLLYFFGNQGRDKGQFWMPLGIFIDDKDYIYVTDSFNSRVQIFQLINNG